MRNCTLLTLALLALSGAAPAQAHGMGDPSTVLKEKNAICDAQRRGEAPRNPDMCMPELPVDSPQPPHAKMK